LAGGTPLFVLFCVFGILYVVYLYIYIVLLYNTIFFESPNFKIVPQTRHSFEQSVEIATCVQKRP